MNMENKKYTKEQFEKLPKWAQDEINSLEMYRKSLHQRLMQFEGKSETNTYIREGLDRLPIQNNAHVEFTTGERNLNTASIYVRGDGTIDVNTDSRLGHTMVVMPRAANSFYITWVDL